MCLILMGLNDESWHCVYQADKNNPSLLKKTTQKTIHPREENNAVATYSDDSHPLSIEGEQESC